MDNNENFKYFELFAKYNNSFVRNPINGNTYYIYDFCKMTIINSDQINEKHIKLMPDEFFRKMNYSKKSMSVKNLDCDNKQSFFIGYDATSRTAWLFNKNMVPKCLEDKKEICEIEKIVQHNKSIEEPRKIEYKSEKFVTNETLIKPNLTNRIDNTLYCIASTKNDSTNVSNMWLINNVTKSKFLLDIKSYDNIKKSVYTTIEKINIYECSSNDIEKYKTLSVSECDIHFTILIIMNTNDHEQLEKCIQSIVSQKYKNYDIICNVDGNNVKSMEIVAKYRKLNSSFNFIVNDKSGLDNYMLMTKLAKYKTVIVSLSAKSHLVNDFVLTTLNFIYYASSCLLTMSDGNVNGLKTFYRELLLSLPRDVVTYEEIKYKNASKYPQGTMIDGEVLDLTYMKSMMDITDKYIRERAELCRGETHLATNDLKNELIDMSKRKRILEKVKNINSIDVAFYRNTCVEKYTDIINRFIDRYLKMGNLKVALLQSKAFSHYFIEALKNNSYYKKILSDNLSSIYINENQINLEFTNIYDFLKDNFISPECYSLVCEKPYLLESNFSKSPECAGRYDNLIYNLFIDISTISEIKNDHIKKMVYSILPNDPKLQYDINFVIPVKNRKDNFECLVKNINFAMKKTSRKILFTVIELDNSRNHEKTCLENNINYICIDISTLDSKFNKSIAPNCMFKLYEELGYNYDWMCYHDVDCVVQENFFNDCFKNLENEQKRTDKKISFLQTYSGGRVHFTAEWLAKQLRFDHTIVNILSPKSLGVYYHKCVINDVEIRLHSKGGSLMIRPSLYAEVGGFDSDLFSDYAPEDSFFWWKVEAVLNSRNEKIICANNPPINIFHLWHETSRNDPVKENEFIHYMENLETLYKSLPLNTKLKYTEFKRNKYSNKINESIIETPKYVAYTTISKNDGIGNNLFKIANLISYSIDNNMLPHILATDSVSEIFSNIIQDKNIPLACTTITEKDYNYTKLDNATKTNCLLDGKFHSSNYFCHNFQAFYDLLNLKNYKLQAATLYNNILSSFTNMGDTVSVCVTRMNYMNTQNINHILSINYYIKAMSFFDKNSMFIIFTDDIAWCRAQEFFRLFPNLYCVEMKGNVSNNVPEEVILSLQSLCKHNIVANCTMSLWGAYLNQATGTTIIPYNWYAPDGPKNNIFDIMMQVNNRRLVCVEDNPIIESLYFNEKLIENPADKTAYYTYGFGRKIQITSEEMKYFNEKPNVVTTDIFNRYFTTGLNPIEKLGLLQDVNKQKATEYRFMPYEDNLPFFIAYDNIHHYMVNSFTNCKTKVTTDDIEMMKKMLDKKVRKFNIYVVTEDILKKYTLTTSYDIHFTIKILSYNNEKYTNACLQSAVSQDYNNYEIIFVNAKSTDRTPDLVNEFKKKHKRVNITMLTNEPRKYQVENFIIGSRAAKQNSIIVSLDGDDMLPDDNILKRVNIIYYATNCLMSYGCYTEHPYRNVSWAWKSYDDTIINEASYRKSGKAMSHLRTWLRELMLAIPQKELLYSDGKYPAMAGDIAVMFPMAELSNKKLTFVNDTMYIYNTKNCLSENVVNIKLSDETAAYFKSKPPQQPIINLSDFNNFK